MDGVEAVLFDAGGVLVGPAGGRWNPRFDFEDVVGRHHQSLDMSRFPAAVESGDAWLASTPPPHPRDGYHRVVLAGLGIDGPSPELLEELDRPLSSPVFEPFPETVEVLERLRAAGLRMAVVTDSWGTSVTKRRQLAQVDLDGYFDVVVVSHELGCTKPDARMFDAASSELGLRRPQCLFVDDVPDLVRAAVGLGYQGAAVVRRGARPQDLPSFDDLRGVLSLLGLA